VLVSLGDGDEVVDEHVDECCRLGEAVVRRGSRGSGLSTRWSPQSSSSGSSLDRGRTRSRWPVLAGRQCWHRRRLVAREDLQWNRPVRAVPGGFVGRFLGGGWKVRRESAEDHCGRMSWVDAKCSSGGEVSGACTGGHSQCRTPSPTWHRKLGALIQPGEDEGPPPFVLPSYLGRMTVRPVRRAALDHHAVETVLDVVLARYGPYWVGVVDLQGCGRGHRQIASPLWWSTLGCVVDKEPGMVHYQPGTPVSLLLNPQRGNRSPGKCRTRRVGEHRIETAQSPPFPPRMKSRWLTGGIRGPCVHQVVPGSSLRLTGRMGLRAGVRTPGTLQLDGGEIPCSLGGRTDRGLR
jgi:hypothetical protein